MIEPPPPPETKVKLEPTYQDSIYNIGLILIIAPVAIVLITITVIEIVR